MIRQPPRSTFFPSTALSGSRGHRARLHRWPGTRLCPGLPASNSPVAVRSEEHTSELQSQSNLVCRLLLEKKQNEMLAYQQKESTARVASMMENTNLSKQQQVSEIMRQMLTQAQTAGQYFTNVYFL